MISVKEHARTSFETLPIIYWDEIIVQLSLFFHFVYFFNFMYESRCKNTWRDLIDAYKNQTVKTRGPQIKSLVVNWQPKRLLCESKGLRLEAIWIWRKCNLPCGSLTLLKARSVFQTRSLTVNHNIMIKSVKGRRYVWLWIPQRPRSVTTAQTETSSREEMGCSATIFFQEFFDMHIGEVKAGV